MKTKTGFTKTILTIIISLIINISFGQTKKIEIEYLGNCGLFMTDGNLNIYVDFPYKSGAYGYMTYNAELLDSIKPNSIFLFTHGHADHFDRKLFKKTNRKLYGPWPVKFFMSGKRKYRLDELNASLTNFSITEFKTKHGYSLKHLSYLIVWNDKRIYISGDTHLADTICSVTDLDIVFAPVWLLNDAFNRKLKIDSKEIILYHHRSVESVNTNSDKIIVPQQDQIFVLE